MPFKHEEDIYLDYEREQLIPEKLSEGPSSLAEDFNGDGIIDLYIGGARYRDAKIYLKQTRGMI